MTDDLKQRLRDYINNTDDCSLRKESAARIEQLEKERDGLLSAAMRQFNADHVLMNMPFDCGKEEHERALDEHTNAHYALRSIIAKLKGQS